jgi:hypothetical protein
LPHTDLSKSLVSFISSGADFQVPVSAGSNVAPADDDSPLATGF